MEEVIQDVIIVGGGAAGLMAAIGAAKMGGRILVLEKMPRPARKIMITGKGRCNFTNVKDWTDFSPNVRSGATFVKTAFHNFKPEDLLDLFEENGLRYVVERGSRAFPESHKAVDVVDALVDMATKGGARILTGKTVTSLEKQGDIFRIGCKDGSSFKAYGVVVSTGGLSYPATGSTGDGYALAEALGHKIQPCFPSLTALVPYGYKTVPQKGHIDRDTPLSPQGKRLCGLSLKNVGVVLESRGKILQEEFGDIDFTDGGLEGPVGFAISRNAVKALVCGRKTKVVIDLKPAVGEEKLSRRIKALWDELWPVPGNRPVIQQKILQKLLPSALHREFIRKHYPSDGDTYAAELTQALKNWALPLQGYVGYERSVITAGGVDTEHISPRSMESRLCRGVFFAGEVLDIDANTGGYNLQCAFSTGMLAGMSAAACAAGKKQS